MMKLNRIREDDYHLILHGQDHVTGLDAIVAVHNINLGPALGGCRAVTYDSSEKHLQDALNLSEGMTYKNSLAGLDLGGGKTALNLHGKKLTEDMLKSLGDLLNEVNKYGHIYTTAGDVGTSNADLEILSKYTDAVQGFEGSDSGIATAYGVYRSMLGALKFRGQSIKNQMISISGFGKVGKRLGKFAADAGAFVIASDVVDPFEKTPFGHHDFPENHGYTSVDNAPGEGTVFSPCALGGAINSMSLNKMQDGKLICGGANNQLYSPAMNDLLAEKNIDYVPDYLANAGGVIIISTRGNKLVDLEYDDPKVLPKLDNLSQVTFDVLFHSAKDGVPTSIVANKMAEERFSK